MIKLILKYSKINKQRIEYTNAHRKAFRKIEKQLLGYNTIRSLFHDLDKSLLLYRIMSYSKASNLHQKLGKTPCKTCEIAF